jgi:hypothetical protein
MKPNSERVNLNLGSVGLMAFWRYDLFPFALCGKITTMKSDGLVATEEYGKWFRPFKIVPYVDGIELKRRLEELTDKYHASINNTKAEFLQAAEDILGE